MVKAHWVKFGSPAETKLNWHHWEAGRPVHMPTLPLCSFFLLLNTHSGKKSSQLHLANLKKKSNISFERKAFFIQYLLMKGEKSTVSLMMQFCPYQLLFAHRLYKSPLAQGDVIYHMCCLQHLSTTGQIKDRVSTHPLKIYVRPFNLLWKQFGYLILFMILSNSFYTSTNTL